MSVNYKDFIHPTDEAARVQLEGMPGFQKIMEWYLGIGLERICQGLFLASNIKLSRKQLPEIYGHLPPICSKFGIEEPEFYLTMNPVPNAFTTGNKKTFLVVTSGLLEMMKPEELDAILAHECGHILCQHVLYHTIGQTLMSFASMLPIGRTLLVPLIYAIQFWSRRSEFSADRAAAVCMGKDATAHALVRLSGGPLSITEKLDFEEYSRQAADYDVHRTNLWNKFLQNLTILESSHPYMSVRVNELVKWTDSEEYNNIVSRFNDAETSAPCPHCGKIINNKHKFCIYCGKELQ